MGNYSTAKIPRILVTYMTILEILQSHNIPYITEGKNVKTGNVNIKCPWCGISDKSEHLGIEPSTGKYACWRNAQHRGNRPHGLVMKLLSCSYEVAHMLLNDVTDLQRVVDRLKPKPVVKKERKLLIKPQSITIPGVRKLTTRPDHYEFCRYLTYRGYSFQHHELLIDLYDLHCGLYGDLTNRVVFPVKTRNSVTVAYTGRCIDNGELRYKSLPTGPVIKNNLLWQDLLHEPGRRLYLCEGPFDALRIDYISRFNNIPDRATCLFGLSFVDAQIRAIYALLPFYEELVILFDRDAISQAIALQRALGISQCRIQTLPEGAKDPGDLSWNDVIRMGK